VDHRNGVIALLAMTLCLGCASARWSVVKHFRDPGASLETFPEVVSEEYDCENQKRPFFIIEKNDLLPEKVAAGSEFGHRLVYVMCPEHSTEVVEGRLSRRIRFKGVPIVEKNGSDLRNQARALGGGRHRAPSGSSRTRRLRL
jgi:hypothetical protein